VGAAELRLAERLIDDLSREKFKPGEFEDTYRQKILKMAEQKAAGQKVTVPSAPKRAKVIDLMSALKNSLKDKKAARKDADDEMQEDEATKGKAATRASRHTKSRRSAHS
jgi:DNA end-binding protein Ku